MSRTGSIILIALAVLVVVGTVAYAFTSLSRTAGGRTSPTGTASQVGAGTSVEASGSVQVSDGGGIQVQATFDPLTVAQAEAVTFLVTMNTHSVELGDFDLAKLSRVIIDQQSSLAEATWQPKGESGGHHVKGTLTVKDPDGLVRAARTVTLEIKGLPGPEVRRFEWKVPGR